MGKGFGELMGFVAANKLKEKGHFFCKIYFLGFCNAVFGL